MAKGLKAGGSSLTAEEVGRSEEALGGHRGLIKNFGGSDFHVSGILDGIIGLLPHILCVKAQQP